jgi:hypothetical protein
MKNVTAKTIDDREYEFYPLAPKQATMILVRLSRIVLEPLGFVGDALAGAKGKPDLEGEAKPAGVLDMKFGKDLPADMFAKAAKALVSRLDEDQVWTTIEQVLANVMVKTAADAGSRKISMTVDFQGRTGHMLKVFVAALEVNYADFFGGEGGGLSALIDKARSGLT